jgi:hypothetical protein
MAEASSSTNPFSRETSIPHDIEEGFTVDRGEASTTSNIPIVGTVAKRFIVSFQDMAVGLEVAGDLGRKAVSWISQYGLETLFGSSTVIGAAVGVYGYVSGSFFATLGGGAFFLVDLIAFFVVLLYKVKHSLMDIVNNLEKKNAQLESNIEALHKTIEGLETIVHTIKTEMESFAKNNTALQHVTEDMRADRETAAKKFEEVNVSLSRDAENLATSLLEIREYFQKNEQMFEAVLQEKDVIKGLLEQVEKAGQKEAQMSSHNMDLMNKLQQIATKIILVLECIITLLKQIEHTPNDVEAQSHITSSLNETLKAIQDIAAITNS